MGGRTFRYEEWKTLCDRYPVQVQFKGGYSKFRPRVIVFTSNVSPEQWWDVGPHRYGEVTRRCDAIVYFRQLAVTEGGWVIDHDVMQGQLPEPIRMQGEGRPWEPQIINLADRTDTVSLLE